MKYRKKPVIIEAHQWNKNGDHPKDEIERIIPGHGDGVPFYSEGKVVRYYRNPQREDNTICKHCDNIMKIHGWIDTLEGWHIVCPGDFVITGVKGEYYPCKPDIFELTYELVT